MFWVWCLHDNYFQIPKQKTSSQTQIVDVESTFSVLQTQERVLCAKQALKVLSSFCFLKPYEFVIE